MAPTIPLGSATDTPPLEPALSEICDARGMTKQSLLTRDL
jgi:hypothetical protein